MATVVISVDAELAADSPPNQPAKRRARKNWLQLVDCFEEYNIPATWAIVGRLCTDGDTLDTPGVSQWYNDSTGQKSDRSADVAALRETNRMLSGQSLVTAIQESRPDHDLGSHSYSHCRFTEITREFAVADLTAAREAMADFGVAPESFVYPFNAVAHRSALADLNFTCYRGTPVSSIDTNSAAPQWRDVFLNSIPPSSKRWSVWAYDRLSEALAYTFGETPPPLVTPQVDANGLVAIPASMPSLYRMPVRLRKMLRSTGRYPLARIAKMGIDAAATEDGIFHLWFHPSDFYTDADFASLKMVLAHLDARRRDGKVTLETMADIATRTF